MYPLGTLRLRELTDLLIARLSTLMLAGSEYVASKRHLPDGLSSMNAVIVTEGNKHDFHTKLQVYKLPQSINN